MLGYIPEHKIAEIQRAVNIVEVIQGYIPLKRAGNRYKALCPFHHEKTPSFIVSPDRQIFKCFGCQVGGDVFKFVMLKERVTFPEAVRIVAQRAGIKLTYIEGEAPQEEKTPLYEVNAWAAAYFQKCLRESPEASYAREYLARRHINEQMIQKFALGYAPPLTKQFMDAAAQAKFNLATLERVGLVRRRSSDNELGLQFRNRLIFPIRDIRQRYVAFGARALSQEDMPKYLNSPESAVFSKSRTLYGISEARDAILRQRRVAIMEGYTDVIMAHQFGIEWAVAVLGTALTHEHVRELKRYADQVILVFDADPAGRKSSNRSLDIFIKEEMPARVATISEGEDPCDFLLNHGAEKFLWLLNNAKDLLDYKMDLALAGWEDAPFWQRARAVDEVLQMIALSPSAVTTELFIQQVAERVKVMETVLRDRLARLRAAAQSQPQEGIPTVPEAGPPKAVSKAQREALQSVLNQNSLLENLNVDEFLSHFVEPVYRTVGEAIIRAYADLGQATTQDVLAELSDPEARDVVAELAEWDETPSRRNYALQLEGALKLLKKFKADSEAALIKERILASDPGQVSDELLRKFQESIALTRKRTSAFYKGLRHIPRTEARLDG